MPTTPATRKRRRGVKLALLLVAVGAYIYVDLQPRRLAISDPHLDDIGGGFLLPGGEEALLRHTYNYGWMQFDPALGQVTYPWPNGRCEVDRVSLSPSGTAIAEFDSTGNGFHVFTPNSTTGQPFKPLQADTVLCGPPAFSPDGAHLAAFAMRRADMGVSPPPSGPPPAPTIPGLPPPAAPPGPPPTAPPRVVRRFVLVWDAASGAQLLRLEIQPGYAPFAGKGFAGYNGMSGLLFSPNGAALAISTYRDLSGSPAYPLQSETRIYSVNTGQLEHRWTAQETGETAWTPNGAALVFTHQGSCTCISAIDGHQLWSCDNLLPAVNWSALVGPPVLDGNRVACIINYSNPGSGQDISSDITLLDAQGHRVHTFTWPGAAVVSIAFIRDGHQLRALSSTGLITTFQLP